MFPRNIYCKNNIYPPIFITKYLFLPTIVVPTLKSYTNHLASSYTLRYLFPFELPYAQTQSVF